jgi:hypothetical protein
LTSTLSSSPASLVFFGVGLELRGLGFLTLGLIVGIALILARLFGRLFFAFGLVDIFLGELETREDRACEPSEAALIADAILQLVELGADFGLDEGRQRLTARCAIVGGGSPVRRSRTISPSTSVSGAWICSFHFAEPVRLAAHRENGGQVLLDARHRERADRFDAGLLGRFEDGARIAAHWLHLAIDAVS